MEFIICPAQENEKVDEETQTLHEYSPEPQPQLGKHTGLVLTLEHLRVEFGVQPRLGRGPFEGHRQHDTAAAATSSGLREVVLDVGRQRNLDVLLGAVRATVRQHARRHRIQRH